jgi:hypothetical protein
MKAFAVAYSIAGAIGLGFFLLLKLLQLPDLAASAVSLAVFGMGSAIHDELVKHWSRMQGTNSLPSTRSQGTFVLPRKIVIIRGAITFCIVTLISTLLVVSLAMYKKGGGDVELSDWRSVMLLTGLVAFFFPFTQMVVAYIIGNWGGHICERHALKSSVKISLMVALLGTLPMIAMVCILASLDLGASGRNRLPQDKQFLFTLLYFAVFILMAFPSIALSTISGVLGWRRGQRTREAYQRGMLLSMLPEKTQQDLVDMAYEEARNLLEDENLPVNP